MAHKFKDVLQSNKTSSILIFANTRNLPFNVNKTTLESDWNSQLLNDPCFHPAQHNQEEAMSSTKHCRMSQKRKGSCKLFSCLIVSSHLTYVFRFVWMLYFIKWWRKMRMLYPLYSTMWPNPFHNKDRLHQMHFRLQPTRNLWHYTLFAEQNLWTPSTRQKRNHKTGKS